TDAQAQHLAVDDNRIAELNLEWDNEAMRLLHTAGLLPLNRWTSDELERLLGPVSFVGAIPEDATVPLRDTRIHRGDLFQLGRHTVLCGDATNGADVARVLNGTAPQLMATDPPYGVRYDPTWRPRSGQSGR